MIDSLKFTVVIEQDDEEGLFVAEVLELRGCSTQARGLDELLARVREAIQLRLEAGGPEAAAADRPRLVGVWRLTL